MGTVTVVSQSIFEEDEDFAAQHDQEAIAAALSSAEASMAKWLRFKKAALEAGNPISAIRASSELCRLGRKQIKWLTKLLNIRVRQQEEYERDIDPNVEETFWNKINELVELRSSGVELDPRQQRFLEILESVAPLGEPFPPLPGEAICQTPTIYEDYEEEQDCYEEVHECEVSIEEARALIRRELRFLTRLESVARYKGDEQLLRRCRLEANNVVQSMPEALVRRFFVRGRRMPDHCIFDWPL